MKAHAAFGLLAIVWANHLVISETNINWAQRTVTFKIRWSNAWRLGDPLNNWDAAWVFVKFRRCNRPWDPWTHGLISTNLNDHVFPPELEPILSDGSAVGIEAAPNNTGVLLRPKNEGIYPDFGPYQVTLKITNLPTTENTHDFRIFGIEMVFIPEAAYYLGTLTDPDSKAFNSNEGTDQSPAPYYITSEDQITLKWHGNSTGIIVPDSFPKGFKAFHVMKYEISEGQYAAFLNTLPDAVAQARYPGYYGSYRNQLNNNGTYPNVYVAERPDRAQNYLSWDDLLAYLDWAALRPITELEYEKICRGPLPPINGEYAWGSTTLGHSTTFSGAEDGTETFTNSGANVTVNWSPYIGGDGDYGPARVGIHAKPGSPSRTQSGAAFYGVMDMSGNVWERVVMVANSSGGNGSPTFVKRWGDGELDWFNARANVPGWPSIGGFRGGGWYWWNQIDINRFRLSHRDLSSAGCCTSSWAYNRNEQYGGRGAR